jgi:hypothetical protein
MPNIAQVPQEMMALIATGFAALGGQLPTREEAQAIGAGEPICSIDAGGAVRVHPKIKKMRRRALRKAQRRPSARRSAPRLGGQLPTREEAQAIGAGEPICSIDAGGAVRVHPKIKKMRRRALRNAQRRPSARRSAPRLGGQPRTARAPRRTRRPAATVRAGDDGGGGDPDPEPRPLAAVSEIQTPDAAAGAGRPPKTGTAADRF